MSSTKTSKDHSKKNIQALKTIAILSKLFGKKNKKSFFSLISLILDSFQAKNLIGSEETKMIKNIAKLDEKKVSTIMTPRADLIAINHGATLEDVKKLIMVKGHTRIPVFRENLDEIIGFIHSKDLAKFLCRDDQNFEINNILHKILFVPGSMKILDLMMRMRMARVHAAIALDEFGGVDGFVTIENVMEEIVGEIEDEHDLPLDNSFFRIKEIDTNIFQFGGRVEIRRVEEIFQIQIKQEEDNFNTIGGFVIKLFNHIPKTNDEIKSGDLTLKIIEADNRSVKVVEVKKSEEV